MSRLLGILRLDVKLQARNKLYQIGIALAVLLGVAGRFLFERESLGIALPAFYLLALGGTTYMFVASLILFEKGEGTLDALKVTPLRLGEYFASKVGTLTAFAVVESLIVLLIASGTRGFQPAPLVLGVGGMGALYTFLGIAQVAPHDTVTDFLIPWAMVVGTVLQLPVFHALDFWSSPIWYVIPTQAPLVVIQAAFRPIPTWEWIYAIAYGGLALVISYRLARARFVRHLVLGGR